MSAMILTLMVVTTTIVADSTSTKQCKEITCSRYEYCSWHESICRQCESLCVKGAAFYDVDQCFEHCQDYVYEKMNNYVRLQDVPDIVRPIVGPIYWLLVVILLLLIVLVVLIGGLVVHKWYRQYSRKRQRRLEDKRFQQKLSSVQYAIGYNNNNSSSSSSSPSPHDENVVCTIQGMPVRGSLPSTTTLTTQTDSPCHSNRLSVAKTLPLSTEEPCEDSTLDYGSYINRALSQSSPKEAATTFTSPKY